MIVRDVLNHHPTVFQHVVHRVAYRIAWSDLVKRTLLQLAKAFQHTQNFLVIVGLSSHIITVLFFFETVLKSKPIYSPMEPLVPFLSDLLSHVGTHLDGAELSHFVDCVFRTPSFEALVQTLTPTQHDCVAEVYRKSLPKREHHVPAFGKNTENELLLRLQYLEQEHQNTRTIEGSFVTLLQEQRTYFEHELAKLRADLHRPSK